MKLSKYTIFYNQKGKIFVFHQISEALLEIDSDLEYALKSNNLSSAIPDSILKTLQKSGFIVEDDTDETCNIRYANIVNRYNSKLLRITILPTLNCNFKCWYCYEQHKPSLMSNENCKAILEFIKSEVKTKNIETIILDWFGGEPLLRFSQNIYPLSKELKNWCEENEVEFVNIITTNGSLINQDMAEKMNEINLFQLQITLDGNREHHNKVKFSPAINDAYGVTVKNIHTLCRTLDSPRIELRINYTKDNINSTFEILDALDQDVRKFILVSPHIVWQEIKNMNILSEKSKELHQKAFEKGYNVRNNSYARRCTSCYTENMEQFVINYDLNVYKCTAREFDGKFSIGKISDKGEFTPNELYYKYYTTESPFMRKKCLECEYLPSCLYSQSCLQKKIENHTPECDKEDVRKSIEKDIDYKISLLQTNASTTEKQ